MTKKKPMQIIGMIGISILVQILVLIRSGILAACFGAGIELDAYNLTNSITTFITSFIIAGITTVALPAYVRKESWESVNSFLTGLFILISLAYMVMYIFRHEIVCSISSNGEKYTQYSDKLLGYTILIQSISTIVSVTTAYCQATNRFLIPKITLLGSNILSVCIILSIGQFSIIQYVQILLFSASVQLAFDIIIALKAGFRFSLSFKFHSEDTLKLFRVFLPIVISSGVYQIHGLVDSIITAGLTTGSVTVLSYSNQVITAVNTLIVGNLTLYAYPAIVRAVQGSNREGWHLTWNYAVIFHTLLCLLICGYFCVGDEFIQLLFGRGKFDSQAVKMTFICSSIYLFGQQFNVVRDLLYRYFYSQNDTMTTLKNSIIISVINIVFSVILAKYLELYGVAIGTIIAGFVSLVLIILSARRKKPENAITKDIVIELIKNETAMLLTVIITRYMKKRWGFNIRGVNTFLLFGVASVLVYLGILLILHSESLSKIIHRQI